MVNQEEIQRDILDWCHYHYKDNLAAVALFDPKPVNVSFPNGDVNVLLILHSAPSEERERYALVAERLVNTVVPNKHLMCRIQTVDEIQSLSGLKLPLLAIYLTDADIIRDPAQVLANACATLANE
jgi:hypothetical protein